MTAQRPTKARRVKSAHQLVYTWSRGYVCRCGKGPSRRFGFDRIGSIRARGWHNNHVAAAVSDPQQKAK